MRLAVCLVVLAGIGVGGEFAVAQAGGSVASGSRIFTVAGGGTERPQDGLPATLADLRPTAVAALPDGTIALVDRYRRLMFVGGDGRLRLPRQLRVDGAGTSLWDIDAMADGSLVAIPAMDRFLYRLAPGGTEWSRLLDMERIPGWVAGANDLDSVAGSPDGGYVLTGYAGVWRVTADASFERVVAPVAPGLNGAVAVLHDGSIAFAQNHSGPVAIVRADGSAIRVPARSEAAFDIGLAALPDGRALRAQGAVDAVSVDGAISAIAGRMPGLGLGDGGQPARALVHATDAAVAPDGASVILDRSAVWDRRGPLDLPARRRSNGVVITPPTSEQDLGLVRVIVPKGSRRLLAAIAPATFRLVRRGMVAITTTSAGVATVTVRRGRRVVARAEQDVLPGDHRLRLSVALTPGDFRLTLRVTGPQGAAVYHRLGLTTLRVLSRRRALRALRHAADAQSEIDEDGGIRFQARRCRRGGPRRFECRRISQALPSRPRGTRCHGLYSARLRPDGVRVVSLPGRRRCRTLNAR